MEIKNTQRWEDAAVKVLKEGGGSSQGTCIKDPWTKTMGGGIECGGVSRAGKSNGAKMQTLQWNNDKKLLKRNFL